MSPVAGSQLPAALVSYQLLVLVRSGKLWGAIAKPKHWLKNVNQPALLKVREAANLLGVSTNTVRAWGASGKLKEFRHPINNYRLFRKDELLKLRELIQHPKLTESVTRKPR